MSHRDVPRRRRGGRGQLGAAVLRGLRARLTLTLGSMLLTTVAVASAVLGPAYQSAATQSFLVARLNQASPVSTGVTIAYRPSGPRAVAAAATAAERGGADQLAGSFGVPTVTLRSDPDWLSQVFGLPYDGHVVLMAKDGSCERLVIKGRCPSKPGEVLLHELDSADTDVAVGETVPFKGLRSDLTVVGTYTIPAEASGFFFDESRTARVPYSPSSTGPGVYNPAPLFVDRSTFDALPARGWEVLVDRRLATGPTTQSSDVRAAARVVQDLPSELRGLDGGRYRMTSDSTLPFLLKEIDSNRATARATVTPAVVSLVLVALALLVRLLGAAADQRRAELALGSLRGLSRRQMWAFGLAEPATILAIATPVGVALGYLSAEQLARAWLEPGLHTPLGLASLSAAALVLVATLGATVLTVRRALAEPLSSQLAGVRRPQRGNRFAMVAQMALIAAAVALVATALTAKGRSKPETSDLLLPLVLALATGLIVGWMAVQVARGWAQHTARRRGIAGFVSARAVSRRQEGSLVILPLTAALAISVFAAGVYSAASDWRASTAATRVGAAYSFTSSTPLAETVAATHEIDPDGRWLMAAGVLIYADVGEKLIVDAPRLGRVAEWPTSWTPGLDAVDVSRALSPTRPPMTFTGATLAMTGDNQLSAPDGSDNADSISIGVRMETAKGKQRVAFLGPYRPGESTAVTRVPFCAGGCTVRTVSFGPSAASPSNLVGSFEIAKISVDGRLRESLLDGGAWQPVSLVSDARPPTAVPMADGGRLKVAVDTHGEVALMQISPADVPTVRPVLLGRSARMSVRGRSGDTELLETGATDGLAVRPVATADSMPFLGPRGLMIDYTMFTRDNPVSEAQTEVHVLARSDTPKPVLDALAGRGISTPVSLSQIKSVLDQDAYALSLNLYLVAAFAAIGLAMAGLMVTLLVQMPDRRRDSASLRVVGVRRRHVMQAVFVEICAVLGVAGLAGIAAGALSQYLVVRSVTLGRVDDIRTPRVVDSLDLPGLSLLVGAVTMVLVVLATTVAALAVRRARAATLRESTR